jgi:hypothetical protein
MGPKLLPLLQSGVIRGLLAALVGLVGSILGIFGVPEAAFAAKGAQVVEALSNFLIAAGVVYAAWARVSLPTPPLTQTAEAKTIARQAAADEQAGRIPQSGFVRPAMLAMMLCLGVVVLPSLQGCASVGLAPADTLNTKIAYSTSQLTAVRTTADYALRSEQITVEQAEKARDTIREIRTLLDTASLLAEVGDISTAEARYLAAIRLLAALQAELRQQGAK